uniref:Uncharacterized protein n=1 Tax=Pyramimonas obovata TaxID=1411642 RepID=A0A7S0MXF6_9CHLO|mmetsp:Transcript_14873/g.31942  ORF Transcript_14873/g.31942 Transcript_14873/m.31942 type:complete len:341 (+) Transcript_14873:129-1151(+)
MTKSKVNPEEEVPTNHSSQDSGGNIPVWSQSVGQHPEYAGLPCVPCCVIVPNVEGSGSRSCPGPCKTACCDLPKSCCTCTCALFTCIGSCINTCTRTCDQCGECVGKCIGCAKACANCPAMVCNKITCGMFCGPKKPKKTCCQRLTCGRFTECSPKCCVKECCGLICGPVCKACTRGKLDCNSPDCSASSCCPILCRSCIGPVCGVCSCGKVNCDSCTECTPKACCKVTFACCAGLGLGGCCAGCAGDICTLEGDFGEVGYGVDCAVCHVTMLPCCCKCVGPEEDLMTDGSFEDRKLHMDRMPQFGKLSVENDATSTPICHVKPMSKPQTSIPAEMSMER